MSDRCGTLSRNKVSIPLMKKTKTMLSLISKATQGLRRWLKMKTWWVMMAGLTIR